MNGGDRMIFDRVAADYDEVRPGYPEELIQDIISISGIPADGTILEIGCGTGQATIPFAKRGYCMVCLDVGKELVALARKNLSKYANVSIHCTSFEAWEPGNRLFDLVMAATAFHWLDPAIAYPKAARVMKESGWLAIFSNMHPTPYTGFFAAVQDVYQQIVPGWRDRSREPSVEEKVRELEEDIRGTGLFADVLVKTYRWTKEYTASQYVKLLNTYSDHQRLDEQTRMNLFSAIGDLIERQYGGKITRPYLTALWMAKKRRGVS